MSACAELTILGASLFSNARRIMFEILLHGNMKTLYWREEKFGEEHKINELTFLLWSCWILHDPNVCGDYVRPRDVKFLPILTRGRVLSLSVQPIS